MKMFFSLQITVLLCVFQIQSCGDDRKVRIKGSEDRNDLVFFYNKDASYEDRVFFEDNVIGKPRADGRGHDLPDGVAGMSVVANSGYRGFSLNFAESATDEQRRSLKSKLESSSLVHRVYENVVPDRIRDLK